MIYLLWQFVQALVWRDGAPSLRGIVSDAAGGREPGTCVDHGVVPAASPHGGKKVQLLLD